LYKLVQKFYIKIFFVQMSSIKLLRTTLGITLAELAAYIDVSMSMLAKAEKSERILSTNALLKLNQLNAQLHLPQVKTLQNAVVPHIEAYTAHFKKQMHNQHKEMNYQILLHQKKLNHMALHHEQAKQALVLVHNMSKANNAKNRNNKDEAWLQLLHIKAKQRIKKTHPLLQAQLQLKIDGMQQQTDDLLSIIKNI
jgi:transcriptional regulator with XRE-family HTH domain